MFLWMSFYLVLVYLITTFLLCLLFYILLHCCMIGWSIFCYSTCKFIYETKSSQFVFVLNYVFKPNQIMLVNYFVFIYTLQCCLVIFILNYGIRNHSSSIMKCSNTVGCMWKKSITKIFGLYWIWSSRLYFITILYLKKWLLITYIYIFFSVLLYLLTKTLENVNIKWFLLQKPHFYFSFFFR